MGFHDLHSFNLTMFENKGGMGFGEDFFVGILR